MFDQERWKPIFQFEPYEVSDTGKVRNGKTKRVLKQRDNTQRALIVSLYRDGRAHSHRVCSLVAEAFLPEKPEPTTREFRTSMSVHHIDYDHTNNHISNLEWQPRWWVTEMRAQLNRTEPITPGRIRNVETGEIFDNTREAAFHYNILEKSVYWASQDPFARSTHGIHFEPYFGK